ncbi:MAG: flavodoxin [Eubacteriales bacterium]|jgi:flavodoxin
MKKMLIVVYSWSNGNTRRIADMLKDASGADLEQIETVKPYPEDYNTTVNQGQREVTAGYKPAIKALKHNLQDYDVIAVGTPTWWYTMAPAVKTFLESNDFSGKTVIPFMTNGGWPGHVIRDMKKAVKNADVKFELQVKFDSTGGSTMETSEKEVKDWTERVTKFLNA